ncbi:MAG: hypothetical protein N2234_00240 [Planctomycetota bacterium]|nr:hypothetical protein [Planctomycetota bacterium]
MNKKEKSLCVTIMFIGMSSCATGGMRNGVAQARHELITAAKSKGESERSERLQRATLLLTQWQTSYGEASRTINDNSFYPVLEEMKGEKTILSTIKETAGKAFSGFEYWEEILGLATALLSGLGLKLYSTNRRHKREKAVMIRTIEEKGSPEMKTAIAKSISNESSFGKEVKKTLCSDIKPR